MNKAELRAAQRLRLRALSPETRARHADFLCQRLRSDARVCSAQCIGIYLALPDEPDLAAFYRDALAEGKCLALPFPNADASWSFRRIQSLEARPAAAWKLLLPDAGEEIRPGNLDVVLVPGLAYSRDGTRLGRGKGIYDRLLAQVQGLTLGCGFPENIVENVPKELHDIRVDEVWTGKD